MKYSEVGLCCKKETALIIKQKFPFAFETNNVFHSEKGDVLLIHKESSSFFNYELGWLVEFLQGFNPTDYLILGIYSKHEHSPHTKIDCGKWYDNPFNFSKSMKVVIEYNFASWSICRQGENCPCPNCEVKRLQFDNNKG